MTDLREPQAGGVDGHQDGPVLQVGNSLEELDQFIKAQGDQQLFLLLRQATGSMTRSLPRLTRRRTATCSELG